MKKDIAKKWVKMLREPGRKQVVGRLHTTGGAQCCLGVLCELAVHEGIIPPPNKSAGRPVWEYVGEVLDLPKKVQLWSGIKDAGTLVDMNDQEGCTFAEIADYIEQNAEKL